jgi:hypothetical protein
VHVFIFYLGEYDIEASKEASKRPNVQETFLRIYLKITIMNEKKVCDGCKCLDSWMKFIHENLIKIHETFLTSIYIPFREIYLEFQQSHGCHV